MVDLAPRCETALGLVLNTQLGNNYVQRNISEIDLVPRSETTLGLVSNTQLGNNYVQRNISEVNFGTEV